MAVMFPDSGTKGLVGAMTASTSGLGLASGIRLYKNDRTPATTDVAADYTVADFSGYANKGATWGSAFINGAGAAEQDSSAITWSHNGGATSNSIYGWYAVNVSGVLICAERFAAAPITMDSNGDQITIVIKVTEQRV